MELKLTREEAIAELEKYGISGKDFYLIDILPLIEMIWSDGKAQEGELKILVEFLKDHVKKVNENAGFGFLTNDDAKNFALKFLKNRPKKELMESLRKLSSVIIKSCKNFEEIKESMLNACFDIASSSVVKYPYGLTERFELSEKKCFFTILSTLENQNK
ncbi:MAG: hypothetical protein RBR08_13155 [Desulforegulaceae bacterium]|nr:hypothetical protein [Desulforegulaceae bacterium]